MINQSSDQILHKTTIKVKHWTKCNFQYFIDWKINIYQDGELIKTELLNLEGKRVYIAFDSSSLGDTIAWIPYVEQFKKKHNCYVVVSTFKNFLFKIVYPELEFVAPGNKIENVYAQYTIGWFYDRFKEPVLPSTIPLQQTATNILGLQYTEQSPNITWEGSKFISVHKLMKMECLLVIHMILVM